MEKFINSNDKKLLKKAYLISKWLLTYSEYILFETKFKPYKNIAYKRGDILKINFGFRPGSELGGVHYAVVIDKNNNHSSDTISVLPMSSVKEKKEISKKDCIIGNEFYNMIKARVDALLTKTEKEKNEIRESIITLNGVFNSLTEDQNLEEKSEDIQNLRKMLDTLLEKNNLLDKHEEILNRTRRELNYMKKGSIVKVGQIVTISKIRIIDPTKSEDVLKNISLSENTMKRINDKIKELYIFEE